MKKLILIFFCAVSNLASQAIAQTSSLTIDSSIRKLMANEVANNINTLKITNAYSGPGCVLRDEFIVLEKTAGTDGTYTTYIYVKNGSCGALADSVSWKFVIRDEDSIIQDAFVMYLKEMQYGQFLPN